MKYLLLLAALVAEPAFALDRAVSVTTFDRIRIEGDFAVEVVTGRGASARISGTEQAIERTSVQVQGQTLIIRRNRNAWGGWQGADAGPTRIRLTTQMLRAAWSSGSSTVRIDRMRAPSVNLALDGSGTLAVAAIEAERIDIALSGSGTMTLAGKVADGRAVVRGSGTLDATALAIRDAKLTTDGSGEANIAAVRTATVRATGSGTVAVAGRPACTVDNRGSGTVACGTKPRS